MFYFLGALAFEALWFPEVIKTRFSLMLCSLFAGPIGA